MDEVRVSKRQLEQTVLANREKHREAFERAFTGYRQACIDALESNLAAFKANKASRILINESPPEDHTKDYDCVLKMLEMSVDTEVTLDAQAFRNYVLDEWRWKEVWAASNSKYLGR